MLPKRIVSMKGILLWTMIPLWTMILLRKRIVLLQSVDENRRQDGRQDENVNGMNADLDGERWFLVEIMLVDETAIADHVMSPLAKKRVFPFTNMEGPTEGNDAENDLAPKCNSKGCRKRALRV
jgi:hypothetical protein